MALLTAAVVCAPDPFAIEGNLAATEQKHDCRLDALVSALERIERKLDANIGKPVPGHIDPDASMKKWFPRVDSGEVRCPNCGFHLPLGAPRPDAPRPLLYPRCPQCGAQFADTVPIERAFLVTGGDKKFHCSRCDMILDARIGDECPRCHSGIADSRLGVR